MLTPQELHYKYSRQPCSCIDHSAPYTDSTSREVFGNLAPYGDGTPYNLSRIVNFLKHVKHPCLPDVSELNIYDNGPTLTYKFLTDFDPDIYAEQQPTVEAGTAYAVRNCCDLSRACSISDNATFGSRMATEYIQYLGHNSLPDCLMACGPDLVSEVVAKYYRAPGLKVAEGEPYDHPKNPARLEDPRGAYLTEALNEEGMQCFPGDYLSLPGGSHSCWSPPLSDSTFCVSTAPCDSEVPGPPDTNDPCCNKNTLFQAIQCGWGKNNKNAISSRSLFSTPSSEYFEPKLKHIGILTRSLYPGWADFRHASVPKLGTFPDIWIDHFKEASVSKARTISLILEASISRQDIITQTNDDLNTMLTNVKKLLTNGYGVLLFTNVGFPNIRESDGLCYPDRIFYHCYNIIGYDSSNLEYNQTVYILHSAFGDWISGGQPYWGDLPTGAFLVTEQHLKAMISYSPGPDIFNCRQRTCYTTVLRDCSDPAEIAAHAGCPDPGTPPGPENKSTPYWCTKRQSPFGLLFSISLEEGFSKRELDHSSQFTTSPAYFRDKIREGITYYRGT